MSALDKLREALHQWSNSPVHFTWEDAIYEAARDYLALLESDAIVIKRDAAGNWPEWFHDALAAINYDERRRIEIADALADSSKAPE